MPASTSEQRRAELAAFLRARRAAMPPLVTPGASAGRRRVPGLRREEVAHLAGVSHTWYTRLEQARDVRPTAQVIDAIARALCLDEDSRRHLRRLADLPAGDRAEPREEVSEDTLLLLEQLLPAPATVLNARFDYVAWNDAHSDLFYDVGRLPLEHRNVLWVTFMIPVVRSSLADWPEQARSIIAQFRAETATREPDVRTRSLIDELGRRSPEFARWWAEHEVRRGDTGSRTFTNPVVGDIGTRLVQLRVVPQPWFKVVAYLPDGESAAQQLRVLQGSRRWAARSSGGRADVSATG